MWFLQYSISYLSIFYTTLSISANKCSSRRAFHCNFHWHFYYCSKSNLCYNIYQQNNRGEKNSQGLHGNVVDCESVNIKDKPCCDTATDLMNVANLALPCANSHSHHFNLCVYPFPQDGAINGHQPNKNYTFHAFDTECIQEVDNLLIYICTFTYIDCLMVGIDFLQHFNTLKSYV